MKKFVICFFAVCCMALLANSANAQCSGYGGGYSHSGYGGGHGGYYPSHQQAYYPSHSVNYNSGYSPRYYSNRVYGYGGGHSNHNHLYHNNHLHHRGHGGGHGHGGLHFGIHF